MTTPTTPTTATTRRLYLVSDQHGSQHQCQDDQLLCNRP